LDDGNEKKEAGGNEIGFRKHTALILGFGFKQPLTK
jgi:hypothetical protein